MKVTSETKKVKSKEASRKLVFSELYEASKQIENPWVFEPKYPGKSKIFDGRTGAPFEQLVIIGKPYILKLIHQVADKIHRHPSGNYTLVTQQPLRGKAKQGGQQVQDPLHVKPIAHAIWDPHFGQPTVEAFTQGGALGQVNITYSNVYQWWYTIGLRTKEDLYIGALFLLFLSVVSLLIEMVFDLVRYLF